MLKIQVVCHAYKPCTLGKHFVVVHSLVFPYLNKTQRFSCRKKGKERLMGYWLVGSLTYHSHWRHGKVEVSLWNNTGRGERNPFMLKGTLGFHSLHARYPCLCFMRPIACQEIMTMLSIASLYE
jgi:hypothetical protein